MPTAWEYLAFMLWNYVGEPLRSGRDPIVAREDSDTGGATALLSVRGADGWELVAVVPQQDPSAKDGVSYVAYMKRQAAD